MARENRSDDTRSLTEIAAEQQARRAVHDDPVVDALMAELLRSLEEVCVLRDRLDTGQRLLFEGAEPTTDAIDRYDVGTELSSQRLKAHQSYYESVFARLNGLPD